MATKRACFPAQFKALGESNGVGRVEAIVSVFGNVDLAGDRVMKGAFAKSIARWKASGDKVPVIFSHQWDDIWSHIGETESLVETDQGLKAIYTLDIADNPVAAQVYRLMKRRSLKEHSFAYKVEDEQFKNGANELRQLDLIELGPTLRGVNEETELLAVKAVIDEAAQVEQKAPPWHIDNDHEGCDGFAVVVDETDEVVGCHETRDEAEAQIAALNANVEENADKAATPDGKALDGWTYNDLQQALRDALRDRFATGENEWCWVRDITDTEVVFDLEGTANPGTYLLGYTAADRTVTLSAELPTEVNVRTTYEPKAATPDGVKAGRRISKANESRMREMASRMRDLADEMESMLDDAPMTDAAEPKADLATDHGSDVLAALKAALDEHDDTATNEKTDTDRNTDTSGDNPTLLLLAKNQIEQLLNS